MPRRSRRNVLLFAVFGVFFASFGFAYAVQGTTGLSDTGAAPDASVIDAQNQATVSDTGETKAKDTCPCDGMAGAALNSCLQKNPQCYDCPTRTINMAGGKSVTCSAPLDATGKQIQKFGKQCRQTQGSCEDLTIDPKEETDKYWREQVGKIEDIQKSVWETGQNILSNVISDSWFGDSDGFWGGINSAWSGGVDTGGSDTWNNNPINYTPGPAPAQSLETAYNTNPFLNPALSQFHEGYQFGVPPQFEAPPVLPEGYVGPGISVTGQTGEQTLQDIMRFSGSENVNSAFNEDLIKSTFQPENTLTKEDVFGEQSQTGSVCESAGYFSTACVSSVAQRTSCELVGVGCSAEAQMYNNNPGNWVKGNEKWLAENGIDVKPCGGRFLCFNSLEDGVKADMLQTKRWMEMGRDTPYKIMNTLSPSFENNTSAMVAYVSRELGIGPNEKIDFNNPQMMARFFEAKTFLETSQRLGNLVGGGDNLAQLYASTVRIQGFEPVQVASNDVNVSINQYASPLDLRSAQIPASVPVETYFSGNEYEQGFSPAPQVEQPWYARVGETVQNWWSGTPPVVEQTQFSLSDTGTVGTQEVASAEDLAAYQTFEQRVAQINPVRPIYNEEYDAPVWQEVPQNQVGLNDTGVENNTGVQTLTNNTGGNDAGDTSGEDLNNRTMTLGGDVNPERNTALQDLKARADALRASAVQAQNAFRQFAAGDISSSQLVQQVQQLQAQQARFDTAFSAVPAGALSETELATINAARTSVQNVAQNLQTYQGAIQGATAPDFMIRAALNSPENQPKVQAVLSGAMNSVNTLGASIPAPQQVSTPVSFYTPSSNEEIFNEPAPQPAWYERGVQAVRDWWNGGSSVNTPDQTQVVLSDTGVVGLNTPVNNVSVPNSVAQNFSGNEYEQGFSPAVTQNSQPQVIAPQEVQNQVDVVPIREQLPLALQNGANIKDPERIGTNQDPILVALRQNEAAAEAQLQYVLDGPVECNEMQICNQRAATPQELSGAQSNYNQAFIRRAEYDAYLYGEQNTLAPETKKALDLALQGQGNTNAALRSFSDSLRYYGSAFFTLGSEGEKNALEVRQELANSWCGSLCTGLMTANEYVPIPGLVFRAGTDLIAAPITDAVNTIGGIANRWTDGNLSTFNPGVDRVAQCSINGCAVSEVLQVGEGVLAVTGAGPLVRLGGETVAGITTATRGLLGTGERIVAQEVSTGVQTLERGVLRTETNSTRGPIINESNDFVGSIRTNAANDEQLLQPQQLRQVVNETPPPQGGVQNPIQVTVRPNVQNAVARETDEILTSSAVTQSNVVPLRQNPVTSAVVSETSATVPINTQAPNVFSRAWNNFNNWLAGGVEDFAPVVSRIEPTFNPTQLVRTGDTVLPSNVPKSLSPVSALNTPPQVLNTNAQLARNVVTDTSVANQQLRALSSGEQEVIPQVAASRYLRALDAIENPPGVIRLKDPVEPVLPAPPSPQIRLQKGEDGGFQFFDGKQFQPYSRIDEWNKGGRIPLEQPGITPTASTFTEVNTGRQLTSQEIARAQDLNQALVAAERNLANNPTQIGEKISLPKVDVEAGYPRITVTETPPTNGIVVNIENASGRFVGTEGQRVLAQSSERADTTFRMQVSRETYEQLKSGTIPPEFPAYPLPPNPANPLARIAETVSDSVKRGTDVTFLAAQNVWKATLSTLGIASLSPTIQETIQLPANPPNPEPRPADAPLRLPANVPNPEPRPQTPPPNTQTPPQTTGPGTTDSTTAQSPTGSSMNLGALGPVLGALAQALLGQNQNQQQGTANPNTAVKGTGSLVTIKANPQNITSGGTSMLVWSSIGTNACTVSTVGTTTTTLTEGGRDGSIQTPPLTTTTQFGISCTTPEATNATSQITVQVVPAAPGVLFLAKPAALVSGSKTKLSWSTIGTNSCKVSKAESGEVLSEGGKSGSTGDIVLTETTQFKLDCTPETAGGATKSALITVLVGSTP